MQRTTAKLPTKPFAKFQTIHKRIKALNYVHVQYEVEPVITLGRYAKSASTNPKKYREICSENGENNEEQGDGDEQVMNNEQQSDKQEHEENKQEIHYFPTSYV